MQHLLPDVQSQSGLPTLELALPFYRKKGGGVDGLEGEMKKPLMKGLNTATPLTLFPPSFFSLPRGVNLAKRRQHQPIYTSCMRLLFFFILSFPLHCAYSIASLALCLHPPHYPASFFFVLS